MNITLRHAFRVALALAAIAAFLGACGNPATAPKVVVEQALKEAEATVMAAEKPRPRPADLRQAQARLAEARSAAARMEYEKAIRLAQEAVALVVRRPDPVPMRPRADRIRRAPRKAATGGVAKK